jgi:large subunit ribosomal protein L24
MKIKKGDNVIVISGKDRGTTGKVLDVFIKKDRVLVEKVNIKKKHQKPRKQNQKGQIVDIAMPIHVSNVQLVEGGKKVRAGFKQTGDKKVRVSKKTGKEI